MEMKGPNFGFLTTKYTLKTGHSVDLFKNIVLIYFVNVGALQIILLKFENSATIKRPNFSMSKTCVKGLMIELQIGF